MVPINLIPAARRRARLQRRRLQFWAVRLALYFAVLVGLCFLRASRSGGAGELLAAQGRQLSAAVEGHQKTLQALNADLAAARGKTGALQFVGTQPDWSLLLCLVADQLGESIVMDSCSLRHVAASGPEAQRTGPAILFDVSGIGRTEKDVSDFALRLETCGLFAEVKQLNASGRTFHEKKAFGFQFRCRLAAPQEEPHK